MKDKLKKQEITIEPEILPYFKFLGYKKQSEIPNPNDKTKKIDNSEIIENRYIWHLKQ